MEPLITDEKPRYARLHGDDENIPENPEALALIQKWKRSFYILLASSLAVISILFGVGIYSILSLQDCSSSKPGAVIPYCKFNPSRHFLFFSTIINIIHSTGPSQIRQQMANR